jgi:hypothetical protein
MYDLVARRFPCTVNNHNRSLSAYINCEKSAVDIKTGMTNMLLIYIVYKLNTHTKETRFLARN